MNTSLEIMNVDAHQLIVHYNPIISPAFQFLSMWWLWPYFVLHFEVYSQNNIIFHTIIYGPFLCICLHLHKHLILLSPNTR